MEVSIRLLRAAFFLLLQIVVSLSSTPPLNYSTQSPLCPPTQSFALLQFKSHFVIDKYASYEFCGQFPKTESWREGTNCCLWEGVECDESTGNVISLNLTSSCLYGQIPTNSSLFQLSHLQTLDLSYNDFNSSPVSSELGRLVNLKHLNFSYSCFSGMIPSQISHLSNLISLHIGGDFGNEYLIFDSLTFEMLSKNLTRLKDLSLGHVNMSAVNLNSFLNLSASLESLDLVDCLLRGRFPANVLTFVNLKYFSVWDNPELTITLPKSNWSAPLEYLDIHTTSFSTEHFYSVVNLKSLSSLYLVNCGLRGPIPSIISNLTQITHLSLTDNNITGEIPTFLSNLKQLTRLRLSRNNLKGQVPDLFGNLTMLIYLDLRSNNLEGHLPSSIFSHPQLSWLDLSYNELVSLPSNVSGLSKLTHLSLYSNKLTGSIPSWLFNLSSLTDLYLWNNQLTGEIPEFQSKSLEYISLEQNKLRGPIPVSMFQLPNLTYLYLSSNSLFFGIRELEGFQKLKSLRELDLSYTNLSISTPNTVGNNWPKLESLYLSSCNITEFPMFLTTQDKLRLLDLSNNNIRGDIPQWMMSVGKETLYYLNLSHNHLTGTLQLPWQNLEFIDLHSNMLQGLLPIPPPKLTYAVISGNNFSGEVSSLYCNMSSLEILDLSHNNLSGTIPSCLRNLTVLSVLNLQMNSFHGTIPTLYAEKCRLRNLNLQGNQLEGKIPSSLMNCTDLEVLDLGHNMFNDEFPDWLKTLQMLRVLILRSNKFHGHLPNFATNDSFSKIQVLDLSSNSLVGHLPNLEDLHTMANVDEIEGASRYLGTETTRGLGRNYDYSVALCIKGYTIEMQKIFHVFTSIDLSNNAFEGEIPFDIGKLFSLKGLNLSHNVLRGRIPPSIGNLKNLEWLDLSSNKLFGEIPTRLVDVISLAILNLSDNQLVGHIPEGKQFNTFTIESYKGNLGLCGYPLPRKCRDEESEPPVASIEDEKTCFFDRGFGWQSLAIGYGCGMLFGVGVGYIMFQYRRPRWLLLIIEDKLRLGPQQTRSFWRRNARRNYKF